MAGGGWPEQTELLPEVGAPRQQDLRFDRSGVTHDAFWGWAEERILSGLHHFAEEAAVAADMGRRVFAAAAVSGFAFIDLCRQRFDGVVMNPPFRQTETGVSAGCSPAPFFPFAQNQLRPSP